MSNDVADEQQHDETPTVQPLDQVALVAALARIHDEMFRPLLTDVMDAPKARLIQAYEEAGQPGVVAKINGVVAGKYTVSTTQSKIVVDDEAALDTYAQAHDGMEVILRRNPDWEKQLLKAARHDAKTGEIFDSRTGEEIPAGLLKHISGGKPTGNIRFTWAEGETGRKALWAAYQNGELDEILGPLRQLMPAPRRDESA